MNCLWCGEEQLINHNWQSFLFPLKKQQLCSDCKSGLVYLQGEHCKRCHRISNKAICDDCTTWQRELQNDPLTYNRSVYQYNEFMKELITKWKYRGDYILVEVFKEDFLRSFLQEYTPILKTAVLVPIPLSAERLQDRAFNQAEALAECLQGDFQNVLIRKQSEKQSKKTRQERLLSQNPFQLKRPINKPVILVDDIYTTGTTLRHAARLLKDKGCPEIYSFTLVRS